MPAARPQLGPPYRSGLTVGCWPSPGRHRLCAVCWRLKQRRSVRSAVLTEDSTAVMSALLRRIPATDPTLRTAIQQWLTELFCADTHYLDWTPPSVQTLSDTLAAVADNPDSRTRQTDAAARMASAASDTSAGVTDAVPSAVSDMLSHSLNVSGSTQTLTGQSGTATDMAASTAALYVAGPDRLSDSPDAVPDRLSDSSFTSPRAFAAVSGTLASDRNPLSDAIEIVRAYSPLSGSDMAKQMGRRGHPMSERTGLRWRDRAEQRRQQGQAPVPAG